MGFKAWLCAATIAAAPVAGFNLRRIADGQRNEANHRDLMDNHCCSWDYETCGNDAWCDDSDYNCIEGCNGQWIDFSAPVSYSHCCSWDNQNCGSSGWCNARQDYCDGCGGNWIHAFCCSVDGKYCGTSDWCNTSDENCAQCGDDRWIDTALAASTCTARWHWCQDSSTCCNGMQCVQFDGYIGCGYEGLDGPRIGSTPDPTPAPTPHPTEAPFCCSWDGKYCGTDDWCNTSDQNCAQCEGWWIDTERDTLSCTARWNWCPDSSTCCEGMECVRFDGYDGCGYVGVDGSPIGGNPDPAPVTPMTPAPVPTPTTPAPVSNPTLDELFICRTTSAQDWGDHKSTAESRNGQLLSVSSGDINSYLLDNFPSNGKYWIGYNDIDTEDQFVWADGSTSSYTNWGGSGPSDSGLGEDCTEFIQFEGGQLSGKWNDLGCNTKRWAYYQFPMPEYQNVCDLYSCQPGPGNSFTQACGDTPPTTPAPVSIPTTSAPVPTPTTPAPVPAAPTGSFITPGYSERITIPQPPVPSIIGSSDGDCPHDDDDLLDWHSDLSLTPSSNGQDVTLPTNTRVVVRAPVTRTIGTLNIPASSELILADANGGVQITMGGMIVEGKLSAGSETCLIDGPVVLTFTGTRPADAVSNPPDPSIKGIDVKGGTISLHGKRYYRTWTRLSQTVEAGGTVLMLQDAVNWDVGQELVLVTTAMKDARDWHQNEVLTIAEIVATSETGAAIRVSTPVQSRHVAIASYQAEVGLLTRSIKIQGAADSEPTDPDPGNCADSFLEWARYGDPSQPCMDKELTGYGAHVMVRNGGKGYVEGVEFFRVGQTNVLGRYPMHFHLLGDCDDCYLRASSIHRSYYRCVSIHATNKATVTENVAFDVSGYCYYLEDGIETENTLSFNLASYIHMIGPEIPHGFGQQTPIYEQSNTLTLPADVTASGFYITNIQNNVIGNTASGGWAGFAFPNLPTPVGVSRQVNVRPSSALPLTLDGNSAHSSGFWWFHTGGFYFGGALFYENGVFKYNPGRSFNFFEHNRETCAVSEDYCQPKNKLWVPLTNTKAYLNAGVGLNSWSGRMELRGFESHDNGLSVESLSDGFWIDNMLSACRSGEPIALPSAVSITRIAGDGFQFYDTDNAHILTDTTFRHCGYRSPEFDQYDQSPNRGCGDDAQTGCSSSSSVWSFLTHSDQFNPELMQGTRGIVMESVGKRYHLRNFNGDNEPATVSGRTQNWLDVDGSVSELYTPTLIASADPPAWWTVDDNVVQDPQGPLVFIKQNDGPERNLAHVHMEWDAALHNQVGGSICGNGNRASCPSVGLLRHRGPRFQDGMPLKPPGDVAGPAGGFGWYMSMQDGKSPVELTMSLIEVDPSTPLLFSIAYPPGTSVSVRYVASYCTPSSNWSCEEVFTSANSVLAVRQGEGNLFHYSASTGLLTIRIVMTAQSYTGRPDWELATWDTDGESWRGKALDRFDRGGVLLPKMAWGPYLVLSANCPSSDNVYCNQSINTNAVEAEVDNVCPAGMDQVSYDKCCGSSGCVFANGSQES